MTKEKIKKIFNLIGIAFCVCLIVIGIVFIACPAKSYNCETPKDAIFGADFYTYEYDATSKAATNAAVAARNIRELGGMLAIYVGVFYIMSGLLLGLYCTKSLLLCMTDSKAMLIKAPEPEKEAVKVLPEEPTETQMPDNV